jgi:hypothetical protein
LLWDTSISLLSGNEPKFRIPISVQDAEQKAKMNKAERFLTGVLREQNTRQLRLGREQWIRELAWYIVSGWYSVFVWIDTDKDDNPVFRWDLYDPVTVYPRWDDSKLVELARIFPMTMLSAYRMIEANGWNMPARWASATETDLTASVKVENYWYLQGDEVYNCVMVDDELAKDITLEEDFDEIPIIVGSVAGFPSRAIHESDIDWVTNMHESIITANRGMYEQMNRWASDLMQLVEEAAKPTKIERTRSGQPKIKPEDLGAGAKLTQQIGEELINVANVAMPVDVNTILNLLDQRIQRGGLPHAIYGNLPFELSGFALSQLMSGLKYKLNPYMYALTRVLSDCALRTMKLYRKGGYKKIELVVTGKKGETFMEEFNPKDDMPDTRYVEITMPYAVAVDKNQLIVAGKQAISQPQVMSRETFWENMPELEIDDKDLEMQRIVEDQINDSAEMKMIFAIEKLRGTARRWQREAPQVAQKINAYADTLEGRLNGMIMPQQVRQPEVDIRPSAGLAGGVMPPERFGESRAEASMNEGEIPPGVEEAAIRAIGGQ